MRRPQAYLAAPLFNDREKAFNLELADALKSWMDVFLPQRDGSLLVEMIGAGVPLSVAERRVFDQDIEAMRRSDVLIAVLDGAVIDDGVAFELGVMRALNKRCVGLQTDVRRTLPSGNNPMIGQALEAIFTDQVALCRWAAALNHDLTSVRRA